MIERLSLLVPGLLAPLRERESRHPVSVVASEGLRQLLMRCQQRQPAELATLMSAYVGASHCQDAAAVAQALALSYVQPQTLPQAKAWLFAAPVWLRPEHAGIYLLGSRPLQLPLAEANAYCDELNNWLKQDGMQLHPVTASRWLLSLPEADDVQWTSLAQAIGRDLRQLAPQGAASLRWQSRLTEWQMLLNQSPLNRARQQRGLPPVHSLWLWGDSPVQTGDASPIHASNAAATALLTENSLLARANPAAHRRLDDLLQAGPAQATVIDERLHDAFVHGDVAGYQAGYQAVMTETIAPLQQALARGDIAELLLYPDDGFAYSLTTRRRWRFWQRPALPELLRGR